MQNKKYKLNFELVPDSCWYSNLRSIMPDKWKIIRKNAVARAGGRCMICGAPSPRLEAHERWEYDEQHAVQRLKDVVAVCPACHAVIHYGRTSLKGDLRAAEDHFMQAIAAGYPQSVKSFQQCPPLAARFAPFRSRRAHEGVFSVRRVLLQINIPYIVLPRLTAH